MRRSCSVDDAAAVAAEVRALVPAAESVAAEVREIVESVRDGGDAAVLEWERRFGGEASGPGESLCDAESGGGASAAAAGGPSGGASAAAEGPFRVPADRLTAALDALAPDVRRGLEMAVANVSAVAAAGLDRESLVVLEQGQSVRLREVPVARAAVYAPGGRAPYPS